MGKNIRTCRNIERERTMNITLGQYKGIEVEKIQVEVTEDEVNAELFRLQKEYAKQIDVTDRAVMDGDIVDIDYMGKKDGVAFEGGTAKGQTLVIGSHTFIEGFEEQVIGHNIGEEFDINVKFPEQYHAPELAGQPAVFTIKLNGIKREELYPVNDYFAHEVFGFDTLAELQAGIKAELVAVREAEAKTAQENAAVDKVIENTEMDIPKEMVDAEVERMLNDFERQLQSQGLSMEVYLGFVGATMESFKQDIIPQAEKSVQTRIVLDEIAKTENIEVTEADVEAEYAKFAAMYQTDVEMVKQLLAANLEGLKKEIAAQKAIDLIVANAKEI